MGQSVFRFHQLVVLAAVLVATPLCLSAAGLKSPASYEMFEKEIRPLLAKHCFSCHGSQKQEAGLRLDSRDAIIRGGDTGPAALAGEANESLLLRAVQHVDLEMPPPPKKKLSDEEIDQLRRWISIGMPWTADRLPTKSDLEKRWETHWAFQPVRDPAPPEVSKPELVHSPIDQFVLARLEAEGHTLSPKADKETLIRRAFYDLIGLPPSFHEVREFVEDSSPDSFADVVDDLLSRKEYGQRWGRHWLDVARYADAKGPIDGGEQRYAFAHTYRDYVIDAFNRDLPYDRFILEQMAADQLDLGEHDPALAAMGFLTLGNKYYERVHEMIDDRIDVVARGLMGLTMGCARCHSHKYDPIPTADYYSWYGVFRSSAEPYYFDKPVLEPVQNTGSAEWVAFLKDYREREKELKDYRQQQLAAITHEMRAYAGDYLEYVAEEVPGHRTVAQFRRKTERTYLRGPTLHSEGGTFHWSEYVHSKTAEDPVFGVWHLLAATSKEALPTQFEKVLSEHQEMHPQIRDALLESPPKKLGDVARAIGTVLEQTHIEWLQFTKVHPHAERFDDPLLEQLRQVLYGEDSPCVMTVEESRDFYRILEHDQIRRLQGAFEKVFFDHANVAPRRALVLHDLMKPYDPYVFVRGDPKNRGPKVPRRFLQMMSSIDGGQPFQHGSGRLELAQAIVHPQNPLTARVMVNRIWGWHFGEGLVRTPSDFGTRSLPPTHPDLLDYLTTRFRKSGWSIKELHRLIMNSATYQQVSGSEGGLREKDPENRLLWRANRRRLDFESFRDFCLATSGDLNTKLGGLSTTDLFSNRRSVYLFVSRLRLASVYSMFDFPNPDLSTPRRVTTITPQQALFAMNHPLLWETSEKVLDRVRAECSDEEERIRLLFHYIYGRDPSSEELAQVGQYLQEEMAAEDVGVATMESAAQSWTYGYGRYDVELEQIVEFESLPYFDGRAYQGGARWPDPKLGPLRLTHSGGHPSDDAARSAIRRWVAPFSGSLRIQGNVRHRGACGDGVMARIVSGESGAQGSWHVMNGEADASLRLTVKKGESVDFVVSCHKSAECDEFEWAPVLALSAHEEVERRRASFSAKEDFVGPDGKVPPLTPWVKMAHAMLQSNEFMFVE